MANETETRIVPPGFGIWENPCAWGGPITPTPTPTPHRQWQYVTATITPYAQVDAANVVNFAQLWVKQLIEGFLDGWLDRAKDELKEHNIVIAKPLNVQVDEDTAKLIVTALELRAGVSTSFGPTTGESGSQTGT